MLSTTSRFMKNSFLFATLLIAIGFTFSACKHDDAPATDFSLTFRSTYDGNQVEKSKHYDYNGHPLYFTVFTLFLSDITLLRGSEEIVVSEAEFLDFLPNASSSNLSVEPKFTYKNVPEGEYTGIRIGYGVKPANNDRRVSDWPAGHPLANEQEYWSGWKSFIFSKIEGSGDKNNDGTFDHYLVYHCGGNGVYKTFTFNQPFHVHVGEEGLKVALDLKQLFIQDDASYWDMVKEPATSNDKNDLLVADAIMSKFGKATKISQ